MNAVLPDPVQLDRMRDAADWLIRLADAPGDEATVAEWLRWCESDAENLAAFQRAQNVWQAAASGDVDRLSATSRISRVSLALAASVVLAVAVTAWMLTHRGIDASADHGSQSFATPIAGLGSGVLADDSKVELGAHSRITTHYSSDLRSVVVDAGEAYFTVMKDPGRPFVVQAGEVSVTAVGTQFNVRRNDDRVVISVREGKVRVAGVSASAESATPVEAGQQAVYLTGSRQFTVAAIHPQDAASWREGVLKYVHEPLSAVVADLSRYSDRPIAISDPKLAGLSFTGAVFTAHVSNALRAFEDVFPLTVVEREDRIELKRR